MSEMHSQFQSARSSSSSAEAEASAGIRFGLLPLTVFAAAHVVLALVMQVAPSIATLHAIICLFVGVAIAARRPMSGVPLVIAYIAGSEVLWRMTKAGVFWEFGKYAVCAVLVVAMLRMRPRRNAWLAASYLALLLPSALLTLLAFAPDTARQQISFNLSGPLSLALCAMFFSNLRMSAENVRTTFFALMGPVIGIATLAYFSTASAVALEFTGGSNAVTSGGFGPNQVSAMLGLGLLFSLLLLLERKLPWRLTAALLALAVIFAAQAALTFSRGGIAFAFLSVFAALFYLVRDRRSRVTLLILGTLLFGVAKYAVVPRLEEFTAGKLSERYLKGDSSGRNLLASYDIEIFRDNPLIGVGPGVAPRMREKLGHFGAAHTEFTRMLAEHGALGGLAILLLIVLGVRTVRGARNLKARAIVVALVTWVTLFLAVHAMRLAAPAVLFGLACSIAYSSSARRARGLTGTPNPERRP